MVNKQIQIITDDNVQNLDLLIEIEYDNMDEAKSMIIKTNYQGKEIVAVGTHCPFDDAYSNLQNKLPKNVQLKCCVACRHGNQCPVGNDPDKVFCTKDVKITSKSDLFYYTENEIERRTRLRAFSDYCDDFCPQEEDVFTYSDYLFFLKK